MSQSLHEGILSISETGTIQSMNPSAQKLFGFNFSSNMHEPPSPFHLNEILSATEESVSFTMEGEGLFCA